jgi:hypothetical protein
MYRVEGSWDDDDEWWDSERGHNFETFEAAKRVADRHVKLRPFKYRRITLFETENHGVVVWAYTPGKSEKVNWQREGF